MKQIIGFIGGGNMASSLMGGLINAGDVAPSQILVFDPNLEHTSALASKLGITTVSNNADLVKQANIVVIAVKPQVLQSVLTPLATAFSSAQPLIISVVAGITIDTLERWLGQAHSVVRIMPNTPALVGAGASGLYANERVNQDQRELSLRLANAVGKSAWVQTEADIDAITALSGSGPAYFMLFIRSLIDSAIVAGIEPETAKQLAVQTAAGTASLIESSDKDLQTLIDNVTSPGGTTEQAMNSFYQSELPRIVDKAFKAAQQRSVELATELS